MVTKEQRIKCALHTKTEHVERSHFLWDEMFCADRVCYGEMAEVCHENECGLDSLIVFHPHDTNSFSQEFYDFYMSKEMFGGVFTDTSLKNGLKYGWEVDLSYDFPSVLCAIISLRKCFCVKTQSPLVQLFLEEGATVPEATLLGVKFGGASFIAAMGIDIDHNILSSTTSGKWAYNTKPNLSKALSSKDCFYDEDGESGSIMWERVWGDLNNQKNTHYNFYETLNLDKEDAMPETWMFRRGRVSNTAANRQKILMGLREGVFD